MTKNIFLSIFLFLFTLNLQAQQAGTDLRTTETKIADLIMKLPAKNAADQLEIMNELAKIGTPVITQLAPNLNAPGKGNDMQIRFAISSLAKHIGSDKDLKLRTAFAATMSEEIMRASDDEVRDFLLQELQYMAGDESVKIIAPLLLNTRLADPAARVMTRIHTAASDKALLNALQKADIPVKVVLTQALGETRYPKAVKTIEKLAGTSDLNLKTAVLNTLAQTGSSSSLKILRDEAVKAGFGFDQTGATAAYLRYLQHVSVNNARNATIARELAADTSLPVSVRSTALAIFAGSSGEKAIPEILKALDSGEKEFRMAALTLLAKNYTPSTATILRNKLQATTQPEQQAELITFMAQMQDKSALTLVRNGLSAADAGVQLASARALAAFGDKASVGPIIQMMNQTEINNIPEIQQALLRLDGDKLADEAATWIPNTSGQAKAALIGIIAARKAHRHIGLVAGQIGSGTDEVSGAAAVAVGDLATISDTTLVAGLLNKSNKPAETSALQQALFNAVRHLNPAGKQTAVLQRMMQSPGAEETRYYAILARAGGKEALAIVENRLNHGTPLQKTAAMDAILAWSDRSAHPLLLELSMNHSDEKQRAAALNSYISGVNRSENPADQKVLMLRKTMELATTPQQKRNILGQLAQNPTLQALVFSAKYLDNSDTEQAAVQSVRSIIMSNSALFGPAITEIAEKAIRLNTHAEAEYQREELMKHLATLPGEGGFVKMFNEKDLTGWKGLVGNPISRTKMSPEKLAEEQQKADARMRRDWRVEDGLLIFEGQGYDNLCSEKMYADFELILDWRMEAKGDGGVYLRGSPQVQTWDTSRVEVGAQVGSGGLYNNQVHRSKPLVVADNPINEWNSFRIRMIGDKVTVYLNGQLVTDNVILENYWDRKLPIFEKEAIELQAHGTRLDFRDIYVREIPRPQAYQPPKAEQEEGFVPLFNGIDLTGWTGNKVDYFAQEGMMVCQPSGQGSGNLFTEKEYSDFILRFEFQLTPGANNGLGIRTPLTGDAAYVGMELQILDNEAAIYANLQPYQYHGSVYGVIPAKLGFLKPIGEWNIQEVEAIGNRIKITLNGEVILDGDLAEASKNGTETIDKRKHPGLLNKSGYIGFLGHGSPLKFRNLRIKDLAAQTNDK
jgi:HEAT repeat protein